jgi:hypothetical protein
MKLLFYLPVKLLPGVASIKGLSPLLKLKNKKT